MAITRASLIAWIQQPTTIGGLSGLLTTAGLVAAGTVTWQTGVAMAVGSAFAMAIPDNTAAAKDASKVVLDVLPLVGGKLSSVNLPTFVADTEHLVSDFRAPAPAAADAPASKLT